MDHRIPTIGLVLSVIGAIAGVITFIYLNEAFKGPSVTGVVSDPYELTATFDDVEKLPTKTDVLSKGVAVGKVSRVDFNRGSGAEPVSGTVTFTVDEEFQPIYRDATARVGERTIIGDAFLDLDRGNPEAGELESGGGVTALASVDFDEALDFLDKRGRKRLRSVLDTVAEGASTEGNGARLNGTIGGISRTVNGLNSVVTALEGQENDLAALSRDASTVLAELGSREEALRTIVGSGRRTLDGLATNTASTQQGLKALPGLLDSGQAALERAQPLLVEARPLVADLRAVAPDLKPVLGRLGPLAEDTAVSIEGLPRFRRGIAPLINTTRKSLALATPVIDRLQPAVRNLVPLLRYLAPRSNGVASFFSTLSSVTAHGDDRGRWVRFNMNIVPPEALGQTAPGVCAPEDDIPAVNLGVCSNAYPKPDDALDPEPYLPGEHERLLPWDPPPRP